MAARNPHSRRQAGVSVTPAMIEAGIAFAREFLGDAYPSMPLDWEFTYRCAPSRKTVSKSYQIVIKGHDPCGARSQFGHGIFQRQPLSDGRKGQGSPPFHSQIV